MDETGFMMDESDDHVEVLSTIFTRKARCRDCYRCLRVCPVKAIRLQDEQATVVSDRCIACGRCIRECPQGAKSFRRDTEKVRRWIREGKRVAASVAPSFAGLYSEWERKRFASALRKLGFTVVEETVAGASRVARKTLEEVVSSTGDSELKEEKERKEKKEDKPVQPQKPIICSACPAAVKYIELYRPDQTDMISTAVSPMLAHGRLLKDEGKIDRVVFIGPCVAKKIEAESAEGRPVDAVLTFIEIQEWMSDINIKLSKLEESGFDRRPDNVSSARLFPLEGGQARTAGVPADMLDEYLLMVSGMEDLVTVLDSIREEPEPIVIEALLCSSGCLNGPVVPAKSPPLLTRRRRLISWASEIEDISVSESDYNESEKFSIVRSEKYLPKISDKNFSEEEIHRILEREGKGTQEERLDCGACGYDTCRDKAIAILRGMAIPEMCIPLMRRLAEQRSDRVIEATPNGIVILDDRLRILHTNPAFRHFFACSDVALGKRISYLMDPAPFEQVQRNPSEKFELTVNHEAYELVCRQVIFALPKEKQYVGIFVNLTNAQTSEKRLEELRSSTRQQARELLEHQIGMAQKMADFLGESTALGEELVHRLMQLTGADTPESESMDIHKGLRTGRSSRKLLKSDNDGNNDGPAGHGGGYI